MSHVNQANAWAIALGTAGVLMGSIGAILALKALHPSPRVRKPLRCWIGVHFWGLWQQVDRPIHRRLSRTCGRCHCTQEAWGVSWWVTTVNR